MKRNDEARRELLRAVECQAPFGHAAEPWNTWAIRYDLERAIEDHAAAAAARREAIASYLAYRRAGGVSRHNLFDLFVLVTRALQENESEVALQQLAQLSAEDIPQEIRSLIAKLLALLHGDRSVALSDDSTMSYITVAELQLLLE